METPDRILTLHPAGKQGVNIERVRYEPMRRALLKVIPRKRAGIALSEVRTLVEPLLPGFGFPPKASVGWHLIAVKQDLEARGEIEQVPGAKPQHLRRGSPKP